MESEILNAALEMALEWGENFHKPIQDRLRAAYPSVTADEADALDTLCREIRQYAFEEVERAYLKEVTDNAATANIRARYPLVNADNVSMMWSQGQYYAWHDNG